MDKQVTMSGSLYGFPGGDTGKRWHVLRLVTEEDENTVFYLKPDDYTSLCKTWGIRKETLENLLLTGSQSMYDDSIIFSDRSPIPLCAHCNRLSKK